MLAVVKRVATMALAPNFSASSIMRSMACSRDSAIILVYSITSPPTRFLRQARMSLPRWRVRMVLPRTRPRVRTMRRPGTVSVVTTIIG